ncbi:lactosylceramide 1,3-N-acetyl-beta-D-glucosaminyltransferase A-like isoform X2 [Nerophis ophidion]|uniref:lactosylceramide 1,3-N-acetyl-beta-D-glucosaminyltransferase A-like isoform X2 n=1 Tax=Nerophis ophidion TaxID=159077 RepID=UPI002ADFABA1|nr:lactosylceramide 1,3-N-acetyl-beta-D-glucosaminyltransferase A-like isoform X2 [Nerophis ophidion]
MFWKFRQLHKCQCVRLIVTCLVLSLTMVCWDKSVFNHFKSYSCRFLVDRFRDVNKSLTITREQARSFSNFRSLLDHPDKCAGKDVLLLVFVKTSPGNRARRDAIRSTWGSETYIQRTLGVTVKVVFALGAPAVDATPVQRHLVQENSRHADLIQQDFMDSFHNLTLKLIMQFHWMHRCCAHARFLMISDDDVFIHMPNLVGYLRDKSTAGATGFWVGRVHWGAPPIRSKNTGGGYVMSGDVAGKIYQATLTLNASLYIDDVFMGICAMAVGVSPQAHVYFSGEGKAPRHLCIYDRMMTSHGHTEDLHDLWKAATHPQVKEKTSGILGRLYCTATKISLLCNPLAFNGYPCTAAFY